MDYISIMRLKIQHIQRRSMNICKATKLTKRKETNRDAWLKALFGLPWCYWNYGTNRFQEPAREETKKG